MLKVTKEELNAKHRAYYHVNKARIRENQKRYERSIRSRKTDRKAWAMVMCKTARARATRLGLPFSITWRDIEIPECCPALGLRLRWNVGKLGPDSASLDRIVPALGYVPGNVMVISHRANTLKSDASADEILAVGLFLKKLNVVRSQAA